MEKNEIVVMEWQFNIKPAWSVNCVFLSFTSEGNTFLWWHNYVDKKHLEKNILQHWLFLLLALRWLIYIPLAYAAWLVTENLLEAHVAQLDYPID